MTRDELNVHIRIGKLPVVIYCEKQYEGICRMLKVTKNNTVFLDYSDNYEDSDGGFRATFMYDTFDALVKAVEEFTEKPISLLEIEPRCNDKFICDNPEYKKLQWDVYDGKIKMLTGYKEFRIGDLWWKGLYSREIRPDCTDAELDAWIKKSMNVYDDFE